MEKLNVFINDFEEYLKNTIDCSDKDITSLTDSMQYSLVAGGKRIRPFLLCEFYKLCGGKENVYPFAAALEFIHTYSLIHDDLPCMDDDDLRRGKPSNHKKFGEDIALLAGDALLTDAFFMASCVKNIKNDCLIKALSKLSFYAGYKGMIAGQVIDLESEGKKVSAETVEKLNNLKTGALLCAACEIGCILADANKETVKNACEFAKNLGLAFQITDDILDKTADQTLLGKPVGSDDKNEKTTFVSLFGIDWCKQAVKDITAKAISALNNINGDTTTLNELALYLCDRKF